MAHILTMECRPVTVGFDRVQLSWRTRKCVILGCPAPDIARSANASAAPPSDLRAIEQQCRLEDVGSNDCRFSSMEARDGERMSYWSRQSSLEIGDAAKPNQAGQDQPAIVPSSQARWIKVPHAGNDAMRVAVLRGARGFCPASADAATKGDRLLRLEVVQRLTAIDMQLCRRGRGRSHLQISDV
jgi:hypothetical protein